MKAEKKTRKLYKIIVYLILCLFFIVVASFIENREFNILAKELPIFPTDSQGYPKSNVFLINGKVYNLTNIKKAKNNSKTYFSLYVDLKNVLKKDDDTVQIMLPKRNVVCEWFLEDENALLLEEYKRLSLNVNENLEGQSNEVDIYTVKVDPEANTLMDFKWCNVDEVKRPFCDKNFDYRLRIMFLK